MARAIKERICSGGGAGFPATVASWAGACAHVTGAANPGATAIKQTVSVVRCFPRIIVLPARQSRRVRKRSGLRVAHSLILRRNGWLYPDVPNDYYPVKALMDFGLTQVSRKSGVFVKNFVGMGRIHRVF